MKVGINGKTHEIASGLTLLEISRLVESESPIMGAQISGSPMELCDTIGTECEIQFLTLRDMEGFRIYLRTLTYVFITGVYRVFGRQTRVQCKHSLSGNLYAEIYPEGEEEARMLTIEEVSQVQQAMEDIIAANLPIERKYFPMAQAMEFFEKNGMEDKQRLFTFRCSSGVNMYRLDGVWDYFYGDMLPETGGLLKQQRLIPYERGVIMCTPSRKPPHQLREFKPLEKLFGVFQQSREWSQILGVENIGALNDRIADGKITELIQTSEALHAKRLAEIAGEIQKRPDIKLVLIAGPSSSGKTTFAQRLMIQLRAEGRVPHLISMDNYFVNRVDTPLDEDGKPNFECLGAVDVRQFNEDMQKLLQGEKVEIPSYNFKKGMREYKGRFLQLEARDILVVEGIHALNEEVSRTVSRTNKYKIYISALTLINIDDHNRIPTTDGRLLRRIIRDNTHRGASAAKTISMWPSVRRGEEENIFPYQEEADIMFNSAHIYEVAVVKQYAEPLLYRIKKTEPEYREARRLLKFLSYSLSVSSEPVPGNSILREFIGGGIFEQ